MTSFIWEHFPEAFEGEHELRREYERNNPTPKNDYKNIAPGFHTRIEPGVNNDIQR